MGAKELTRPSRVAPTEPPPTRCQDCRDFGVIGDLAAIGSRGGYTYQELAQAIATFRLAICECPAGKWQTRFLAEMSKPITNQKSA